MKNVLLLVHDDVGQEARFQAALDLTRAIGGHLKCVDVSVLPVLAGGVYSQAGEAMLLADEREREGANKRALQARLAHEDVPWDWLDITGSLSDSLVEEATLADIIVVNRKLDSFGSPDMRDVASRVVMRARKPILAVPDALKHFSFGRCLIAWDGHASVAATVKASIPLLSLASAVEIFMIRDGAEGTEPTEVAEYLSRYGIHAVVRIVDDGLHAADRVINEQADRWRADCIIMGAYSRGRFVETFGGVTKRMLAESKIPLILGH